MIIAHDEVRRIADLARLRLGDAEVEGLGRDLNDILEYVDLLAEVDVSGVPPLEPCRQPADALREDVPAPSQNVDDVLKNAPRTVDGFVAVPRVIDHV